MRVRKITEVLGAKVYTDSGEYFGEIEEANLQENKIDGWRIRVGGSVMSLIGGARGVIIPHQFVRAISDVFIINKSALPSPESVGMEEVTEM
ncbi:PRC-barrel domain-containing protein [Candidatus Pacearchaeota archaeon]|nr:PRC-barrel domain-containing protein [Candidatus Pacearchaeota archaeon]